MGNWKVAYITPSPHEAELVRGMLEANGIDVVVMVGNSTPYPQMGETELHVAQDDLVRAMYLVRKHQEE